MVTARDVRELLDDRPGLEPAVAAVLDVDEPFTFDDLGIDSGAFGELVSRGVVEKTAGGDYRVADREAVRRGLEGDVEPTETPEEVSRFQFDVQFSREDRLTGGLLLAGLALVVLLRLVSFPTVFRESQVVLSGNDPYYYRVVVEQLVANPAVTPSTLPAIAAKGEPLMVVTLWVVASVFGGLDAVGGVLAWYPVFSAVVTALLVYAVAVLLTDDRRVGLAAVVMLAVLPGHAMRTSLGYADHHAFDYPWLALTLLAIVLVTVLARREEHRLDYLALGVVAIALGVSAQVLAWDNGPLLVVPAGLYLAAEGVRAVAADESPLWTGGPVVLGVAVAAALTWTVHARLGWHTSIVAAAPALVAVGGVGVLVAAEAARRAGLPAWALGVTELVGTLAGALVLRTLWPDFWAQLTTSVTNRLLATRAIAETRSLFVDSLDWLFLFGLLLVLALPYVVYSVHRARRDARWLAPGVYGLYFLLLATVQIRFVGELSPFVAVFAGLAFVHLLAGLRVVPAPAPFGDGSAPSLTLPSRRTAQTIGVVFLVVCSFSLLQVPLKINQVTTGDGEFETAMDLAAYSDGSGMEYPENYVLSRWGDNRMYNYFVSGRAASYGYAQSTYVDFVTGTDGHHWYEKLGSRRGFVVTTDDAVFDASTLGTRLHEHHGSRSDDAAGLGHYRLVAANGDGAVKAFAVVPGAIVRGTAEPNATVTVETEATVDGTAFTYVRETTANAEGEYSVRVAYPGRYHTGNGSVSVPDGAVRNGSTVDAG